MTGEEVEALGREIGTGAAGSHAENETLAGKVAGPVPRCPNGSKAQVASSWKVSGAEGPACGFTVKAITVVPGRPRNR
jgi:hypothetical protein